MTLRLRHLLALATVLGGAPAVMAQIPDSAALTQIPAAQARALLQQRPDLAAQLRQRIGASGLTTDQIHARLRAAGYPEDLLDPYLNGSDSTAHPATDSTAVSALELLGVLSSEDAATLRGMPGDSGRGLGGDTIFHRPDTLRHRRDTLKVFGLDVFRPGTTQFQAALAGPVDDNYLIGPGDVLVLILTGQVEQTHTLDVNREGFIVVPQVGQLFVANQTLGQLRQQLVQRLGRAYSGVGVSDSSRTRVQLSLGRLRGVQVYVSGDVSQPGAYTISGSGTVLTALYAAGGPTAHGSMRDISVRRGATLIGTVDLYDYLLHGINRADVRLATGDVVFVPPVSLQAKVTGEVQRPAIYELRQDETLVQLLQDAGGLTPQALQTRVQIHRILPPAARGIGGRDRVVVDVSPDAPFAMAAGDSVVVFKVAARARSVVAVRGAVWTAGSVGFAPGMLLSQAIRAAGGPKPDAYRGTILINRLLPDSTRTVLRSTMTDSLGGVSPNIALREDDEVEIFSRSDFRDPRYIIVSGAVRKSGRVEWRDGMTLRDAVLESSGLREDALLNEAEIARMPADHHAGELAITVRVPLDSTYLIDRGADGRYLGPPGLPAPASGAPEVTLRPYDNILILRQPEWELPRRVFIGGAVKYPGVYTLRSRTEKIFDLLSRAGGLTAAAYPAGVSFFRKNSNEGRIGIDLPSVLRNPNYRDNLIMQAGDSVFISEYSPVIRVGGAVNAPIAVAFVPGMNLDYYVSAAGGYARTADVGRAYVTQPDGRVQSVHRRFWVVPDDVPHPQPGAVVEVPVKERRDGSGVSVLSVLATTASIIASLATVLIATKQ